MPADLEFEAEWILSVHRVGVVPKEDQPVPGNIAVERILCVQTVSLPGATACARIVCLTASQGTSHIG